MSVTMRRTKTLGAVPMTEQAVWGVGSAGKPRAPSQRPVPGDSATPTVSVTDNVGRAKKKKHHNVGVIWFPRRDDTLVFLIGDFTKRFMTPVVAMPSVILRISFLFFLFRSHLS